MAAHKVEPAVIDPGRKMSLMEFALKLRSGQLLVITISKLGKTGGYRASLPGGPEAWPDYYVVKERNGRVIIEFHDNEVPGARRVLKRERPKGAWITLPASVARDRVGIVLAEKVDNILVLYP